MTSVREDEQSYAGGDIATRLRERAKVARSEGTGTGLGDALHFEEAANEIDRLQRIERNRDMWKGQCDRQAEELRRLREYAPDEPDPDRLRDDRDERQRLAKEHPNG